MGKEEIYNHIDLVLILGSWANFLKPKGLSYLLYEMGMTSAWKTLLWELNEIMCMKHPA